MPTNASTPYKPSLKASSPRREVFDPWNTASTGHQRAENRLAGSTSWRQSRTLKLNAQFGSGESEGGGKRIADTVGAGARDYGEDGRTETGWDDTVQGWRGRERLAGQGWGDVGTMMQGDKGGSKKRKRETIPESEQDDGMPPPSAQPTRDQENTNDDENPEKSLQPPSKKSTLTRSITPGTTTKPSDTKEAKPPQIFSSLCIQINGTTYPTISDHKLKYLLTSHGASLSITQARRTVTHVIVGRSSISTPSIQSASADPPVASATIKSLPAGGGLAGSKLQKEITMRNGGRGLSKGTRYVSVEWVIESVKAGVRLSESRFPGVSVAPRGVGSVRDIFGQKG